MRVGNKYDVICEVCVCQSEKERESKRQARRLRVVRRFLLPRI